MDSATYNDKKAIS